MTDCRVKDAINSHVIPAPRCSNWKITSDLICVSGCDKLAVLSFWAQWYLLASSSKQLLKKKKKKTHCSAFYRITNKQQERN